MINNLIYAAAVLRSLPAFGSTKKCVKCKNERFLQKFSIGGLLAPAIHVGEVDCFIAKYHKDMGSMKITCDKCGYEFYEQPADKVE
jgi:hypothetical protein